MLLPLAALTWKLVAAAVVTAYVGYEIEHHYKHTANEVGSAFFSVIKDLLFRGSGLSQLALNKKQDNGKNKQIDERLPSNPDDLLNDSNWQETGHPGAKAKGHRFFENKETGEKLRHDEGKPGESGHEGESHWHRYNPNSTGKHDEYLDANDYPVRRHSNESHLYPKNKP